MTELKTVNAIYSEYGRPGIITGGTLEQQEQTIIDTINFFKKHLK